MISRPSRAHLPDQRHRGHDLAGLAVAALGDVVVQPGLLHRVQAVRRAVTVSGSPSMVVTSSSGRELADRTAHGLNALPLMWDVQALQTLMPQPYFGPVTPRQVAQHPQQADVVGDVDGDGLAVEDEGLSRHAGAPQ